MPIRRHPMDHHIDGHDRPTSPRRPHPPRTTSQRRRHPPHLRHVRPQHHRSQPLHQHPEPPKPPGPLTCTHSRRITNHRSQRQVLLAALSTGALYDMWPRESTTGTHIRVNLISGRSSQNVALRGMAIQLAVMATTWLMTAAVISATSVAGL